MGQQAVSSDPGSAYMRGLTAEFQAALVAETAWRASRARLRAGYDRWQHDESEIGKRNAAMYRCALADVEKRCAKASARTDEARREITAQQEENLMDYEERVRLGLAR